MDVLEGYNQIIGAGGFGLILKNNADQVAKLYYSGSCNQASIEYEKHLQVYKAFLKSSDPNYDQLCISKPLIFNKQVIVKNNEMYSCFYIMTLIHSINPIKSDLHSDNPVAQDLYSNTLYHIINNDYSSFNKEVGRVYNLPISNKNPSRGFFATYNYIETNILPKLNKDFKGNLETMSSILQYMGYAFGVILYIAEYKPIDVEYVLAECKGRLAMAVLDFGMIEKIDWNEEDLSKDIIDNILDIDLYYPVGFQGDLKYFNKGMKDAFEKSNQTPEKINLFNTLTK